MADGERRRAPWADLMVPKGWRLAESFPTPPLRVDLAPRRSPLVCAEKLLIYIYLSANIYIYLASQTTFRCHQAALQHERATCVGLCSYGLHSYGLLYSHGLYSHGPV